MYNTLLFVMVAAIFVHTFFNFFLAMYAKVVSKASGVPIAAYSVEEFFSKVVHGVFNWFKHL